METDNSSYKFLLVDDHMIIRTGLKILISEEYFGCEIDEAENSNATKIFIDNKKYDLIILDINIPDDNIYDFVSYLRVVRPEQKILMFSMNNEEMYAKKFFKLGVKGYLSKQTSDSEVKVAINTILKGRIYISELIQSMMVNNFSSNNKEITENVFDELTAREFQIVSLILKGESSKEIGNILNLQISTISTHKAHIYNKLKIKNPLQLAELARLHGLNITY